MPRERLLRLLMGSGAACCIPAVVVIVLFARGIADDDAFEAAPPCAIPSQGGQADCVSILSGTITSMVRGGSKFLPSMTVAVGNTTATFGYQRSRFSFDVGGGVATGWWRGQPALIGPSDASPTIITDQSPPYRLQLFGLALGLVIPAVSLLLAGVLVLQAPMNVDELILSTVARSPEHPRPLDRLVTWRVAWAYRTYAAYFAWAFIYLVPLQLVQLSIAQPRLAPVFLIGTLVITFGLTATMAALYLASLIRTSERRTVVVQTVEQSTGRAGNLITITYGLANGRVTKKALGERWYGHVTEGARLDVLADPKSGWIRHVISTPPAEGRATMTYAG